LEANAANLLPTLKPFGSVNGTGAWFTALVQSDPVYAASLTILAADKSDFHALEAAATASDPCMALGIDLPETILGVTQQLVTEANQPESNWSERALRNLAARTPDDWFEVLDPIGGVRWVTVHDDYAAARALILDRLLPGIAERGWFVAPVSRNNLYFMPATEHTANDCVFPILRLARKEYEGVPYQISNQLFWVYQNNWYRYPIFGDERVPTVFPPLLFQEVFGFTKAIDEANAQTRGTKDKAKSKKRKP
jgi:hypothetical protein